MDEKIKAKDVKKSYGELKRKTERVDLKRLLTTLANHDAAVEMLARAQDKAEVGEVRGAVAAMIPLFDMLEEWTSPDREAEPAETENAGTDVGNHKQSLEDPSIVREVKSVKVYTDGASKGNPGPAAIGILITDLEGGLVFETGRVLEHEVTNNVAEYQAIIDALEILVENGCPKAYFFADSSLVVNQMKGLWKVKHPDMMPLVSRAQRLRQKLPYFEINHVRRESNRRADELANLALKQKRDASKM